MTKKHVDIIQKNFGSQADEYLSSSVHATGEDLAGLRKMCEEQGRAVVLDLGCGGGHVSYTVAPYVESVVAYDVSERMLEVVAKAGRERGLANIRTLRGRAESMPFSDAAFDFVFSRYSAHHWHDVGLALRQAGRVLKPGGKAVFIDVVSPGFPVLDIFLQTTEMLRDTSHVRDYSASEWLRFIQEANLTVDNLKSFRLELAYASWIGRMRTPEPLARAIRELQKAAPNEVIHHFALQDDGSFTVDAIILTVGKENLELM